MNTISKMLEAYYSGKSVKDVGKMFGLSTGKAFYELRDAGCQFRKKGVPEGWHPTSESIAKIVSKTKGQKRSAETKARMSEAKKSKYNGMNGYGHTKVHNTGYILAYAPLHPFANSCGYVMLHRLLVERKIGRYLSQDEVVHHKNKIRNDNRLENLVVMDRSAHMSMHMVERNAERMISY
jgi:hypothetical protein